MIPMNRSELPQTWVTIRIGDVVDDRIEQGLPQHVTEFVYIDISTVDNNAKKIKSPRVVSIADAPSRARQLVKVGDVLVSTTRPNLNAVAMVPPELDGAIASSGFVVLRAIEIEPAWLFAVVQSGDFVTAMTLRAKGALYPAIRPLDVQDYVMPLPPLSEQNRIVSKLTHLLGRQERLFQTLELLTALIRDYQHAILMAACTGTLVPTEAKLARSENRSYESAKELIARTKPPPKPTRYSTRSTDVILGHPALAVGNPETTLPEGWTWSPLIEIARMESGHTPSRRRPEWWTGNIPWIGIVDAREHHGGVINDTLQYTNEEGLAHSAARLLPKGTVCVSRTASVGYVVVMGKPMATSQDFVNWVPTSAVLSDWLKIVFMADREALMRFGKGAVHNTIYFPEWLSVHIALPPIAEQRRIVTEVHRRLEALRRMELQMSEVSEETTILRGSLFHHALTGRWSQSEFGEPSELLLERIRARKSQIAQQPKPSRKRSSKRARKTAMLSLDEIKATHLKDILLEYGRPLDAKALWHESRLSIDDFYAQLKREMNTTVREKVPERLLEVMP
jgi:type I restriction enzyme S subunit